MYLSNKKLTKFKKAVKKYNQRIISPTIHTQPNCTIKKVIQVSYITYKPFNILEKMILR